MHPRLQQVWEGSCCRAPQYDTSPIPSWWWWWWLWGWWWWSWSWGPCVPQALGAPACLCRRVTVLSMYLNVFFYVFQHWNTFVFQCLCTTVLSQRGQSVFNSFDMFSNTKVCTPWAPLMSCFICSIHFFEIVLCGNKLISDSAIKHNSRSRTFMLSGQVWTWQR